MQGMKKVRSQLRKLVAERAQERGKNVSLRSVHRDAKVPLTTVMGLANNTIERVTLTDIQKLCFYFGCDVGDLLRLEDVPGTEGAADA
jgi:DNA-binding Xre family transcriptional regulator